MKNISRRVFIKGMAVAAVATAASTVLTGCKLPTGVDQPVVEEPTNDNVVTFTDGDNTVKFTVLEMTKGSVAAGNEDNAYIKAIVENDLGAKLLVCKTLPTNASGITTPSGLAVGDYVAYVTAYRDNSSGNGLSVEKAGLVSDTAYANGNDSTSFIKVTGCKDAKTSVSVKVALKKIVHISSSDTKIGFTEIGSAKTFTYNI